MTVTPSGIVTLVRLVQPVNAREPMPVTPSEITTLVILVLPANASSAMLPVPEITSFPSSDKV